MMKVDCISSLATLDIVELMNNEDEKIPFEVKKKLEVIVEAIEKASEKFMSNGRLIYVGAGTSGRLGYLDAIELEPTYGVSSDRAFGVLAGGKEAMFCAVEGAEDSKESAINDLEEHNLTCNDVVIAISASGDTPYTVAATKYAKEQGALTIGVTCTEKNLISEIAMISIDINLGSEIILGSTRMKAGSAQKTILNMLSTGIMIKCGKVYQNFMIYMNPTNKKLKKRAVNIISDILNIEFDKANMLLNNANNSIPIALIMGNKNYDYMQATCYLADNHGKVRLDV